MALAAVLAAPAAARADLASGFAAYDRGDYRTALSEFRVLADQGDAAAQFVLGRMYENGQGVRPDRQAAIDWYSRSAQQGYAPATTQLARIAPGGVAGAQPGAARPLTGAPRAPAQLAPTGQPPAYQQPAYQAPAYQPPAHQPPAYQQPQANRAPVGSAAQDALVLQRGAGHPAPTVPAAPSAPSAPRQITSAAQDALALQRMGQPAYNAPAQLNRPSNPAAGAGQPAPLNPAPAPAPSHPVNLARAPAPEAPEPAKPAPRIGPSDEQLLRARAVDQASFEKLYHHFQSMTHCSQSGIVEFNTKNIAATVKETEKKNQVPPQLAKQIRGRAEGLTNRFKTTLGRKAEDDKEFECRRHSRLFAIFHNKLNPL